MFAWCEKARLPLAIFFLALLAMGCNQDAIFYYISGETAPTKPLIQGSPSKMVEANLGGGEKLYVANGRVWEYDLSDSAARWSRVSGPAGYVADLASTSDGATGVLYALVVNDASTELLKNDGTGWTGVPHSAQSAEYGFVQNIYGAGALLFATGAKRTDDGYDHAILAYGQSDTELRVLAMDTPLGAVRLTGAGMAGNDYYLATLGNGVYKTSDALRAELVNAAGAQGIPAAMAGFLQTPAALIGISRNGYLVYIDAAGARVDDSSLGGTYTGALALMDLPEPREGFDKLLLLGYRGPTSSFEHGYMELLFKSGDGTHDGTRRVPGEEARISSVSDYRQYDSSLRRYPVAALWVMAKSGGDESPVIFAATSNQGLYSYRARSDGGWQWNHEE